MADRGRKVEWDADPTSFWRDLRRWQADRRRIEVEERLERAPYQLSWLVDEIGLTEKQREACILRFGYELTFGEIASRLGISKNAVVSRIDGARRKVDDYWGTWPTEEDPELARKLWEEDPILPQRVADYLLPLIRRQRALERVAERLGR